MVEMFHVKHFREVFAGKGFIVDFAAAGGTLRRGSARAVYLSGVGRPLPGLGFP
jgi:hypothetical protein